MKKILVIIISILGFLLINIASSEPLYKEVISNNNNIIHDDNISVAWSEWILVKATKLLLQFTIVIWITMVIWWWITFLHSFWNSDKMWKARDRLFMLWFWILLAISASAILKLVISFTSNTLWW